MRVHVVCIRPDADRVLPRHARYLTEHNRWSLSEQPDINAAVNLYMNYLVWDRHRDFNETKLAAYYTHRDEWNAAKAQIWDDSAEAVDLRITTARRNLPFLEKFGQTTIARAPVERDRFTIKSKRKSEKPVVGVAGYTYGDNRKGEHLISALIGSKLKTEIKLVATGRGWPLRTEYYDWQDLPQWFQRLDVLVVPSMFEGIPMPPLEALACGVKVVIPRDVGMLDELPDIPGIYRFTKGQKESFIAATEEAAFSGKVDQETLRTTTECFTPYNWAKDHERAIEELIYCIPRDGELPSWKGNSGVYLVAFGEPSRQCAERALGALKVHMPYLPTYLASTAPLGPENGFVERPDIDIGGRLAKLAAYDLAPQDWQYVLYMDADTEVVGDSSFLFQVLADGWEVVICRDMAKYCTLDMMKRPDNIDECEETWQAVGTMAAFQFNGGVFGFRRCARVQRFFELWHTEWQKYGKRDQGALIRALYRQPLRVYLLHNQWNATTRYELPKGEIKVLHHNTEARRWGGLIDGRTDSQVAWDAVRRWENTHPNHRPKI